MKNNNKTIKVFLNLKFLLVVCLLTLSASSLFSQNKRGQIEGFVKDAQTGEALPFAYVVIQGTNIGTNTDDKGFYQLKGISVGEYTMKISFVGYADSTLIVNIGENSKLVKDIALTFGSALSEIIITAQAAGQVRAINNQLTSRNIKNVVSDAKIRELPDANAAEALSRLPGVSVERQGGEATKVTIRGVSSNTVYVNGMRMEGGLGGVASSMLGSIEVSKAFMPDQDADVLGGSVDFKMREAESGFKKEITFRQGYNYITKSFKMQDVSLLLGNRFFNDKLGVMANISYDRKNRGRESYFTNYSIDQTVSSINSYDISPILINSASLSKIENLNKRLGITLSSDFKLSFGKLFYQGFYSSLKSDNVELSNNYGTSGILDYNANGYVKNEKNIMNGVGADITLGRVKIDFSASLSNRLEETPDRVYYYAANPNGRTLTSWLSKFPTLEQFTSPDSVNLNINNTILGRFDRSNEKITVDEYAYKLNIEIPYRLNNFIDGYLKFGGKIRDISRTKDNNERRGTFFAYNTGGGYLAKELNSRYPELAMDDYLASNKIDYTARVFVKPPYETDYSLLNTKLYYLPDFNLIKNTANKIDDLLFTWRGTDGDDYTSHEQFFASYIMTGINFGKYITFTPGVRYEKESFTTTARALELKEFGSSDPNKQGIIKDTSASAQSVNFCPMFHLKIKPVNWFDIRLAYTRTITRPDFYLMSPTFFQNYSIISAFEVRRGNPKLTPQRNTNYDICLSFYGGKIGLFTVNTFYKTIENQIFQFTRKVLDATAFDLPPRANDATYSQSINNPNSGYIKGLELDWQNQFGFLPKPFNGIILNTNVAFMKSETRYPFYVRTTVPILPAAIGVENVVIGVNESRTSKIIGQPDITYNLSLGYEIGGLSWRISYYYQGFTLTEKIDYANDSRDVNIDPYNRVDFQLSYKIKKIQGLMLYLNLINITNTHDRKVYTHFPDRVRSDEVYGASGDIGLRYKF